MAELPKKSPRNVVVKSTLPRQSAKVPAKVSELKVKKAPVRVKMLREEASDLRDRVKKIRTDADATLYKTSGNLKQSNFLKGYHSDEVVQGAPKKRWFDQLKAASMGRTHVKETPNPRIDTQSVDHAETETLEEVVTIPNAASARLVAKTKALKEWYKKRFPEYAARTSYFAGFIFIVVAGTVLATEASTHYSSWADFQRAALCTTLICNTVDDNVNQLAADTVAPPAVVSAIKFITTPPSPLTERFDTIVRAEHVSDVVVTIESRDTGITSQITSDRDASGADSRYLIDPALLPPGSYQLRASGRTISENSVINVTGPRFTIEKTAGMETINIVSTTSSSSIKNAVTMPTNTSTVNKNATSTLTSTQEKVETNISPTTSSVPHTVDDRPLFTVTATDDERFVTKLQLTGAANVEIFAQRAQASEPFFIGSATKFENNYWSYVFLSTSLPSGSYGIFSRATLLTGAEIISDVFPIFIASPSNTAKTSVVDTVVVPNISSLDTSIARATTSVAQTSPLGLGNNEQRANYLAALTKANTYEPDPNEPNKETTVIPSAVSIFIDEQLITNADTINGLLQRYASAFITDDHVLMALAREQLEEARNIIAKEALNDPKVSAVAYVAEKSLIDLFYQLERRVEKFETLLRDRDKESLMKDSDGDGLADYDEELLYGTYKANADTDGDGINDGAEIAGGFNPVDAIAESMMRFSSPKDFGLVRDDILQINSIAPIIETDDSRSTPLVQTEITGKGLPNSFVTIFIYSTPVIVTVKTDTDGSFVYKFDRELEDGTHEVYVAMTDNTGAVLAKSNPFRFIKEAEAFTALNVNPNSITTTAAPLQNTGNIFNTVIALVVLTFGLILIIIGLVLRREQPAVVTQTTPA